jgi:hypothetical protein
MTTNFRPYEGWEEDLLRVASVGSVESPHRNEVHDPARRLLAAFEPPKCGKVLHGNAQIMVAGRRLVCNLPAGHHPFDHDRRDSLCLHRAEADGPICRRFAGDPIHSPVHGNTDLEGSWRDA